MYDIILRPMAPAALRAREVDQAAKLEQQLATYLGRIAEFEAERDEINTQLASMAEEYAAVEAEIAAATDVAERDRLEVQLVGIDALVKDREDRLGTVSAVLDGLAEQVQRVESEIAALDQVITTAVPDEISPEIIDVTPLEVVTDESDAGSDIDLDAEVDRLAQEIASLVAERANVVEQLRRARNERDAAKDAYDEAQAELSDYLASNQDGVASWFTFGRQPKRERVRDLQDLWTAARDKVETMDSMLAEIDADLGPAREDLAALKERRRQARRERLGL